MVVVIIGVHEDIDRFLTLLEGTYRHSRRELLRVAALCGILFGGGVMLLHTATTSLGTSPITTTLLYLTLAVIGLLVPIWLYAALHHHQCTVAKDGITVWRGNRQVWSIHRTNIDRIMYSSGTYDTVELTVYQHTGPTGTLACPADLNDRITVVLSQWNAALTHT